MHASAALDNAPIHPVRGRARLARFLGLAILVSLLLVARNPAIVASPRFLAEEADIFFANAWLLPGAEALWSNLTPRLGYVNFYPILATWIAAKTAPLELAPALVLVLIGIVQGFGLALALAGPRRDLATPLQRALAAAVLLYFPYQEGLVETWLSVMNAPVHFGVIALLLLLAHEASETRAWRLAARVALGFAALTGPYVIVIAPLFALKWLWTREREVLVRTGIVAVAAAVQVAVALSVLLGGYLGETRAVGAFGPQSVYTGLVFQFLCAVTGAVPGEMLLTGLGALPGPWLEWRHAAIALAVSAAVLGGAWWCAPRTPSRTLLLLAIVLWFGFTSVFAVKGVPANRYVVCPSVAFGLLLVHAAFAPGARRSGRAALGMLLVAGLATGVVEALLWKGPLTGVGQADWRREVAAWRADPDHPIRVWPSSIWYTHLAEPSRRDALRDTLARMPSPVTVRAGLGAIEMPLSERGLPAYFAIRYEACTAAPADLLVTGRSSAGATEFEQRLPLAPGCGGVVLNSMMLAFAGFSDFSRVTNLSYQLAGSPGVEATLGAFRLATPVDSVLHPYMGR